MPRPHPSNSPQGLLPADGILARWTPRGPLQATGTLVDRVLAARGMRDPAAAGLFLSPSLTQLHEPSLLPGLDRAAQRLLDAARARLPIVIYTDYDVDGISAGAILFHVLRALEPDAPIDTYVPHRIDEGYGLHEDAIASLAQRGARVIVTVDCGITARSPARVARDAGVDLIITDHHAFDPSQLPDAFALVHPRLPDSAYPFPDLSGSAVAFKLAWRLATLHASSQRVPQRVRDVLLDMLALASLGVIADVVPLQGENRVIARFGLARLKFTSLPGLAALIEASGLDGESVSAEDVGFRLAPRLNACGRLGHAREALELLTTAAGDRAHAIAEQLTQHNELRRAAERSIFDQAATLAGESGMTAEGSRGIVLAHPAWHQGVVGIVCSRLVERFHRPTILLQDHGEECHGSARSIEGFDLLDAIAAGSRHLLRFGGHAMAAGLALRTENLDHFRADFLDACNARLSPDDLIPHRAFDALATLDELTIDQVLQLQHLAPFGRDNPPPTFRVDAASLDAYPKAIGANARHLTLSLATGARPFRLVAWNLGHLAPSIPRGRPLDVLFHPKINDWNGVRSVEGQLLDLRLAQPPPPG